MIIHTNKFVCMQLSNHELIEEESRGVELVFLDQLKSTTVMANQNDNDANVDKEEHGRSQPQRQKHVQALQLQEVGNAEPGKLGDEPRGCHAYPVSPVQCGHGSKHEGHPEVVPAEKETKQPMMMTVGWRERKVRKTEGPKEFAFSSKSIKKGGRSRALPKVLSSADLIESDKRHGLYTHSRRSERPGPAPPSTEEGKQGVREYGGRWPQLQ